MATPLTLTIGGDDFLPIYKTGSGQVTAQIKNQGDSLRLSLVAKQGDTLPTVGSEIIFKDASRFLFGGFITGLMPMEAGIGQLIDYSVEASDYTYILVNKLAQATYTNQTLAYIVNDLLSRFVDTGYAITQTAVATGPTIPTVTFNQISIRQCFEKLAKLTNYIWWLDYEKDLHFIDPTTAIAAPETFTDTSANVQSIALNTDCSQLKNQVILQGGVYESSSYVEIIKGDGQATGWVLTYQIYSMTSIEVDTGGGYVSKVIGIEGVADETLCDFMYNTNRGSFRVANSGAAPAGTDLLRVTYTYPIPVQTVVQDAASISIMRALEGGDGIHTAIINDSTLVSQEQAIIRGQQELSLFSLPLVSGKAITRTSLLQAGSYFTPGQALTVNLPSWGITVDTAYLIQSVVTSLVENGSAVEYIYEITFGGRLLGITDFMIALATPENALEVSQALQLIVGAGEVISISDVLTIPSHHTQSETVTLADSITPQALNYAVEFVLGPEVPTGTKRQFMLNSPSSKLG